jgi:hypothetical protein
MTERWEELYGKALKSIKIENPSMVQQMIINTAILDGVRKERKRISDWIEENRRYIEIDEGVGIYRDSFDSESLLKFINQPIDKTDDSL